MKKLPQWATVPAIFGGLALLAALLILLYVLLLRVDIPELPSALLGLVLVLIACFAVLLVFYGVVWVCTSDDEDLP